MAIPPSTPPLNAVLEALKAEFKLTDEQFATLPSLDQVDLVHQDDSHLIEHAEPTAFTYHPYKLYIGEKQNEPWHVYLYRTGNRKQYKLEISTVDLEHGSHHEPYDATYFGTVSNLAYPFNSFLGSARFTAVVKWYFVLAFRAGVFDEDPGFSLTTSWRRDLQGACDELIAAPEKDARRKQKDERGRIEGERGAQEMERRKSLEAVKQASELRRPNTSMAGPKTEVEKHTPQSLSRKGPAPTMDCGGSIDTGGIAATNEQSILRAKSRHAAEGKVPEVAGGTEEHHHGEHEAALNRSWVQDVERVTATEDENGVNEESTETSAESLEEEWMKLHNKRVEINRRLSIIEDEMGIMRSQVLFEKLRTL
mgnify:CR=1 FL=1